MGRRILASSLLARAVQSSGARRFLKALEEAVAGSRAFRFLLRDRPEWLAGSRTLALVDAGCGRVQTWMARGSRVLGSLRRESVLARPGAGEGWAAAPGPALLGAGLVGALGGLAAGRPVLMAGSLGAMALGLAWPLALRAWRHSLLAAGLRYFTRL